MARYKILRDGSKVAYTAEEEKQLDDFFKSIKKTDVEIKLETLRQTRNSLLDKTDWWASSDVTMTDAQKKYRQDLRDLTNGLDTVEKVNNVVFPTKPKD